MERKKNLPGTGKLELPGFRGVFYVLLSIVLITIMSLVFIGAWMTPPLKVSVHQDDYWTLYVSFTNTRSESGESLKVLRNVDGALYAWCMPYYTFEVVDQDGEPVKKRLRCGNFGHPWGGTLWPMDYVMELEPGETRTVTVPLPFDIPHDGMYTVTFEYIYEPWRTEHLFAYPYPEDLWQGRVKSKPVHVRLMPGNMRTEVKYENKPRVLDPIEIQIKERQEKRRQEPIQEPVRKNKRDLERPI